MLRRAALEWLVSGRLKAYYVSALLYGASLSCYYTYSRALIADNAANAYSFAVLLVALESIPGIISLLLGFMSDRLGRKRTMWSGIVASLVLFAIERSRIELLPLLAVPLFLFLFTYHTSLYGTFLSGTGGSGRRISVFGLAASTGWFIGGLLPGVLSRLELPFGGFAGAGLLLLTATGISLAFYPSSTKHAILPKAHELLKAIRLVLAMFVGLALTSMGINAFFSLMGIRLKEEIPDLQLYGLVYTSLPGLFSLLAKPASGIVADRFNPIALLALSMLAYSLACFAVPHLHGLSLALLWLFPIYAFYETFSYTSLSRILPPRLHSTAAGVFESCYSIGGFMNILLLLYVAPRGFASTMLAASAVLFLAFTTVIAWWYFSRRRLEHPANNWDVKIVKLQKPH